MNVPFVPRLSDLENRPLQLYPEAHTYFPEDGLIAAVNAALALMRPLLLTGEPGCGKTQLAHAVAHWLHTHWTRLGGAKEYAPLSQKAGVCIVRSDGKARDLLYRYDALSRYGDAQLDGQARLWARNPRNYLSFAPLGRALVEQSFSVVLVDEIDKSPRDLPNDLLDVLTGRRFQIEELREDERQGAPDDVLGRRGAGGAGPVTYEGYIGEPFDTRARVFQHWMEAPPLERSLLRQCWPLIVITSNTERQLPAAFLRRCVCHHIAPLSEAKLEKILATRFDALYCGGHGLAMAVVKLFSFLRRAHEDGGLGLGKPPTTAELVDALEVLETLREGGLAEFEQLKARLPEFVEGAIARDTVSMSRSGLSWQKLPFLACLVKLESDLKKLPGWA